MSDLELSVGFAAIAVLTGFLYFKHRQRLLSHSEHHNPVEWTGRGIDTSEIKQTVEAVRRDYEAARPKAKGVFFHRTLLGFARRAVARLAYFHERDRAQEHRP